MVALDHPQFRDGLSTAGAARPARHPALIFTTSAFNMAAALDFFTPLAHLT
jgi:hypothetical protein